MKELSPALIDKVQEVVTQVQKLQKVDSLAPYPGQKLWELNPITGAIMEIPLSSSEVEYTTQQITHRVRMNPECSYVLAINKKTAEKKFFKAIKGSGEKKFPEL